MTNRHMSFRHSRILALGAVALSAMLFHSNASAYNFNNETCNVQLDGDILLTNTMLTITTTDNDQIELSESGNAVINGQSIDLTRAQRQDVIAYVDGFEATVPKAMALAAKAIELTNEALTEVFTGLLGEGSELPKLLNKRLNELQQKLESTVYPSPGTLVFDSRTFGSNIYNDKQETQTEFERDLDQAIEEITSSAMAEMLVLIGKSMLSGDGAMQDFETRMQTMGDNIDAAVSTQSEALEQDATALCEDLIAIDETEDKLQSITELKDLNLLNVSANRA
ncbi:DUF2884 family protein [Ningiella sp. W23]|uniref:DUF2884 family protein n=1 Tax=Ningiella sp. W23 TaxID=3023715 RepID=UPI0037574DB5